MLTGASIKNFSRNIMLFREIIHEEIHPMQMIAFLEVASTLNYTVSANYLCDKYGISQAAASRHCRVLTDRAAPNRSGYDVCRWVFEPSDHRTKFLELTEKGKEALDKITEKFK